MFRALVLEKTAAQASLHKLETELATVKRCVRCVDV